ncbi:MAG: MinD/ParA family protein [Calditrichia bacterium]
MVLDQAHNLKKLVKKQDKTNASRNRKKVFGLLSGKGGVGKSLLALNSAILLSENYSCLLIDGDFLTPSQHVLANVSPRKSLELWLKKPEISLSELIIPVKSGLDLVTSEGEGFDYHLKDWQYTKLLRRAIHEGNNYDVIILDFPTGYFPFMNPLIFELDEIILISSPEPTSVIDTYAMVKLLVPEVDSSRIKVLINMADNEEEANQSVENLNHALTHFLSISLEPIPPIYYASEIKDSVKQQKPIAYENSSLVKSLSEYLAYCLQ